MTNIPAYKNRRYTLPEGIDFGLSHLDYMLSIGAVLPDDRRSCALLLAEMKQVYCGVFRKGDTYSVTSILGFPKQDSAPFSRLLKRRVPQALIILAYYCVLLDVLDCRWWIQGWASRIMRDIVACIGSEQWRSWIEWPVQVVLMKGHLTSGQTAMPS